MPAVIGTNYVLNIYVHKVTVQKHVCCIDGNHETCLGFKFLNEISFEICQPNDPRQRSSCECTINFSKGKTCLFLSNEAMVQASSDCKLYIEAWQKMSCACLPSKLGLGTAAIDLSEQLDKINAGETVRPMKGYYAILNPEEEEVAVLDMMIRLSKLDTINLNDFTMNEGGSNFMVKGNEECNAYTFKKTFGGGGGTNECDPKKMIRDVGDHCCGQEPGHGGNMGVGGSCGGGGGYPSKLAPVESDTGCGCFAPKSKAGDNDHEEIGVTLNGNQIKIRVPKSKTKGTISQTSCNQTGADASGPKERTIVFGENEVFLNMKQSNNEGSQNPQAFSTKFTTGDPNAGKPTLVITPSNVPNGVEAMKVIDQNKDVFLLKINKKCRAADKANLELELVTPKPPEKPPKPQSETRTTQYDEADCPLPPPPPPEPEPEVAVLSAESVKKDHSKPAKSGKKDKKKK